MIKIYKQLSLELRRIALIKAAPGRLFFKAMCYLLFLFLPALAQAQSVVNGTVKDNGGVAVIGATVTEKGAKNTTTTDVNGKFKITFKGNSRTLVVSYIGYKTQEFAIGGAGEVTITLQENLNNLNEVVVVGYSSKQVSQLSSSVSVINGNKLRDVTSNDLNILLQGKAPG